MVNRLDHREWSNAFCKIINQSVGNFINIDHAPAWHDTQTRIWWVSQSGIPANRLEKDKYSKAFLTFVILQPNLLHYRDMSNNVAFHKNQMMMVSESVIEKERGNRMSGKAFSQPLTEAYCWYLHVCTGYESLLILVLKS